MKRIKTILTISLLLTAFIGNAQIKVHDNNHVSIGSLGKTYGIQVYPNGYITFANPNTNATIVTMTKVTTTAMRSWLVKRDDLAPVYRFYVNGYGNVFRNASYSISNPPTLINIVGPINNPTNALNQINGYYYTLIDEDKNDNKNDRLNVGLSAEEIGKVIPEAVVTTEEGDMYINYEVLTVFLIEAIKEQQTMIKNQNAQIDYLSATLNKQYYDNSSSFEHIKETNNDNQSKLLQNYPNPFSNETIIDYYLANDANNAEIMIFNLAGETLKVFKIEGHGVGSISINLVEFNNGIYYYGLIENNTIIDTKKMIISK